MNGCRQSAGTAGNISQNKEVHGRHLHCLCTCNDNKSHASRFVTLTDLGASESRNSETRNAGCYQKPLKLEAGKDGTFLETRFWIEGDQIRFRLKNDNEGHDQKVWRYQT